MMIYIFLLAIVAIAAVVIVLLATNTESSSETKNTKALFKGCANNFDCPLGYNCELRDHPSKGICVIPPGGACHSVSGKDGVCYSGYYCDKQDGVCLKQ